MDSRCWCTSTPAPQLVVMFQKVMVPGWWRWINRGTGPAVALPSASYSGHHMTNSSQSPAPRSLPTVTVFNRSPRKVILPDCTRYLEWRGAADPEHWYWEVTNLTLQLFHLQNWLVGEWWENLKQKVREAQECCQRPSWTNLVEAWKIRTLTETWTMHSWYILTKNLAAFRSVHDLKIWGNFTSKIIV